MGKLYDEKLTPNQKSSKTSAVATPVINFGSGLIIILGAIWLLPYGDLDQAKVYAPFALGMGVMGLGFVLSWGIKKISWWWFWGVAIAARIILLFTDPGNDIWRYLWEGYIQLQGFSPYDYAPNAAELSSFQTSWWWKINHPDVSAIYPPLTQLGFRALAWFSPSVILFKSAFVAADLGVCVLLVRRFGLERALIYAWNPLILYSFASGGHYDSWFVLPLALSAYVLYEFGDRRIPHTKLVIATVYLGISIAIKWISLPVLGFLVWRSYRQSGYKLALAILMLGVAPFLLSSLAFCATSSCQLIPTSSSFVSHGRYCEFLPFFLARVWAFSRTTNSIFAIPLGLGTLWLIFTKRNYYSFTQAYFFWLLIISPIIHFWYFTWIVPFGVAKKNLGIKLLALSSLVYFVVAYRLASSSDFQRLTVAETLLMWLPFVIGYLVSASLKPYYGHEKSLN